MSAERPARPRRRPGPSPRSRDGGFSLLEVMVSIAIISVVLAALTTLLVGATAATRQQGSKQIAVQLAGDGIETVRAMGTEAISRLPATSALPVQNNVGYTRTVGVQRCLQAESSEQWCGSSGAVAFFRVTVVVTWRDRTCPSSACSHSVTTLVNAATEETFLPTAYRPAADGADRGGRFA